MAAKRTGRRPDVRRPNPEDVEVGRRIRVLRIEAGMSQTKLGEQIGVTFQQVQKYERGMNRVGAGRLQHIANALDTPITFFFDLKPGDAARQRERPESLFRYLQSRQAIRLVRAFDRVKSGEVRTALVAVVEIVAEQY